MSSFRTTLIAAGALCAGAGFCAAQLRADQIRLTNGNVIEGTVVSEGERIVVQIGDSGRILLRPSEVASIARTDEDAAAEEAGDSPAGRWVAVTLKRGTGYYGNGVYTGQLSSASDEEKVILEIAGGKITIPRDAVAEIVDVDAPVERTEEPTSVTTTHRLHMKNGRILRGNLLASAEDAPYLVAFGDLGVMEIPRRDVERIEEAEDTIELPQPVEEPAEAPEEEPSMEEMREQLREEIREEILRELFGAAIDDRLESTIPAARIAEAHYSKKLAAGLLNDEILEIEFLVRELGRQRTNNRVRAERKLADFGPSVLPFLCAPAVHPFDLTRRAIQRIVRDVGDFRGAPLSIAALDDEDPFVRSLAHDALRELLPEARISYHADAPPRQRVDAQAGYWQLWEDILLDEAREIVLEQLAADAPR